MKGLILKDLYILSKQLKFFVVIIALWAVIPGINVLSFAMVYASMFSVSVLAYDERANWNTLAATMPYSKMDMVKSKYILGYLLIGGAGLCGGLAQLVAQLVRGVPLGWEFLATAVISVGLALLVQAINLPLVFKFGTEKGRLALVVVLGLSVLVAIGSGPLLQAFFAIQWNVVVVCLVAIAILAVLTYLSQRLAARFFQW